MPPLRRLVLGLNAATVVLVVIGLLLLVVPTPLPSGGELPTVVASAGAVPDTAVGPVADHGVAERVVRTNIFSARRSPPARRFMFGEVGDETAESRVDSTTTPLSYGESVDSTMASTAMDPVPHLYGTMLGPAGGTALLRLDARISEPRLYRVGDRAGGYRVTDIGDRSATLTGPNGRVVLRLARPDQ